MFSSKTRAAAWVLVSLVPAAWSFSNPPSIRPEPLPRPSLPSVDAAEKVPISGPALAPVSWEDFLARAEEPAHGEVVVPPELHQEFVAFVRQFEAARAAKAGVPQRIAHAVTLLQSGRQGEAVAALLAVEQSNPGLYQTAVKLGLAYELAGNLDEAVLWVARGLERDPQSQVGTEWLHVAILRAKVKLRDDPNWLAEKNILDGIDDRSAEEMVSAIEHQLDERLKLVSPPDPIVCDLFFQAAIRLTRPHAAARRAHYLRESLRFGPWRAAQIAVLSKT